VEPARIAANESATGRVDVTNTGGRAGDEVPQLCIHQRVASVTQPVMALKAFRRVTLKPGEKTTVEFKITPETIAVFDENMHRVVQPGTFDILVGPSPAQTKRVTLEVHGD